MQYKTHTHTHIYTYVLIFSKPIPYYLTHYVLDSNKRHILETAYKPANNNKNYNNDGDVHVDD